MARTKERKTSITFSLIDGRVKIELHDNKGTRKGICTEALSELEHFKYAVNNLFLVPFTVSDVSTSLNMLRGKSVKSDMIIFYNKHTECIEVKCIKNEYKVPLVIMEYEIMIEFEEYKKLMDKLSEDLEKGTL
jgi:hypothetical protein